MLRNMAKFLGTLRLVRHPPWLRNIKAHCFNKGKDSKHSCESFANKDSDSKETMEDKKKEKGPENQKKKRW